MKTESTFGRMLALIVAIACPIVVSVALAAPAGAQAATSDVVWWNQSTGVVSSWLQNGAGHVLGSKTSTGHAPPHPDAPPSGSPSDSQPAAYKSKPHAHHARTHVDAPLSS